MARKIRAHRIHSTAQRVSRSSRTVKHIKLKLTAGILIVLLAVVGAYTLTVHLRTERADGCVEVVVGSSLMARLESSDIPQPMTVREALDTVAVRPASQQVIRLTVDGECIEVTAQQAEGMTLQAQGDALVLYDASQQLGNVTRIYLPTGSDSVKTFQ